MVSIEFIPQESIISEEREEDLLRIDGTTLKASFFVFPLRFSVNDIELFGRMSNDTNRLFISDSDQGMLIRKGEPSQINWLELPLLDFVLVCCMGITNMTDGNHYYYTLPYFGYKLNFSLAGENVHIYSSINKRETTIEYSTLLHSVSVFNHNVISFLAKEFPKILHHPELQIWVKTISS